MKLKDAWGAYDTYTGKVSDLARQLAFAGIAIIWLFKIESPSGYRIETGLIIPLLLLTVALFLDLVHYMLGARTMKQFAEEKEGPDSTLDDEVGQIERNRLAPMIWAFRAKAGCVLIAYGFMLYFLAFRIVMT